MRPLFLSFLTIALVAGPANAQQPAPASAPPQRAAGMPDPDAMRQDQVVKDIDDVMWHLKLGDIAHVDKVRYTSLPPARITNPNAPGAKNPLIISAYTFIPKNLDRSKKHPLIVFTHGGVHSNFGTSYANIVRELVEQGYSIVATDYRGSTGYGAGFWMQIDYGGREVDDVDAGRAWMLENHPFLDPKRVGAIGWSHGGMISLLNIFERPDSYAVCYAGVPVSDLVARLGYQSESYRALYSASYHIGKTVREDIQEYLKRSPMTHVAKLRTPLLIHTTTNDEDVNFLEVQRLIQALKAEGKQFEHKIYPDAPGGHAFNRLDTKLAKESRAEIWRFLNRYLKPERGIQ